MSKPHHKILEMRAQSFFPPCMYNFSGHYSFCIMEEIDFIKRVHHSIAFRLILVLLNRGISYQCNSSE